MCLPDINIYYFTYSSSLVNAKELFNLCHGQAHNVIECIFGVLTQCFWILLPPYYPLNFQPHILTALCALQNFIQEIDQDEGKIPTDSYQTSYEPFPSDISSDCDEGGFITDDDKGTSDFKLHRMLLTRCGRVTYSILQMKMICLVKNSILINAI